MIRKEFVFKENDKWERKIVNSLFEKLTQVKIVYIFSYYQFFYSCWFSSEFPNEF